jgi:hypothetical protein
MEADTDRSFEDQLVQTACASENETDRLRNRVQEFALESDRLRAEARRLQEVAERLLELSHQKTEAMEEAKKDYQASYRLQQRLKFEAFCLALRRNDPTIQDLEGDLFGPEFAKTKGYAQPLGEALRGNTNVSAFCVHLDTLTLSGSFIYSQRNDEVAYIEPLVNFVSTSKGLQRMKIAAGEVSGWHDHLSGAFMEAIGASSSIEVLTHRCRLPCTSFHAMMEATSSLKRLDLDFLRGERDHEYDRDELILLTRAFRDNRSLQRLRLGFKCGYSAISRILSGLSGHSTLQELELYGDCIKTMVHWNTMCQCLCSMQSLLHLKLVDFQFSAERMNVFLNCLVQQDSTDSSYTPITKLSFDECHLDDASTALLVEFMKTEMTEDTPRSSYLRDLCFDDMTASMANHLTGPLMVSLLVPLRPSTSQQIKGYPTIGSQLTSLSFDVARFDGWLEALTESAHNVQLDTLRLVELDDDHCKMLKSCVLRMPCLRHLRIAKVYDPSKSSHFILETLRENESLRTFFVEKHGDDEFTGLLFNDAELRLAAAYCQRNRYLLGLLEQEHGLGQPRPSDRAGQALHPTLLQAAKQIPKSLLVSELLKLGDCIGPA